MIDIIFNYLINYKTILYINNILTLIFLENKKYI